MDDSAIIKGLLAIVDLRNGDTWGDACCAACLHNFWHTRDEYGSDMTPCTCVCHPARGRLGWAEDDPVAPRI